MDGCNLFTKPDVQRYATPYLQYLRSTFSKPPSCPVDEISPLYIYKSVPGTQEQ